MENAFIGKMDELVFPIQLVCTSIVNITYS